MALTMPKPAVAATSTSGPQRVGPATRASSGASQPEFQVPEIDGILGVGARGPDSDTDASWDGFGNTGRDQGRHASRRGGARAAAPPTVFHLTTASDIIVANQIVTRHLGPVGVPLGAVAHAVGIYDRAIQAVTGTLPSTYLGNRLDVAL